MPFASIANKGQSWRMGTTVQTKRIRGKGNYEILIDPKLNSLNTPLLEGIQLLAPFSIRRTIPREGRQLFCENSAERADDYVAGSPLSQSERGRVRAIQYMKSETLQNSRSETAKESSVVNFSASSMMIVFLQCCLDSFHQFLNRLDEYRVVFGNILVIPLLGGMLQFFCLFTDHIRTDAATGSLNSMD